MPDENKFRELAAINWQEQKVCGLCKFFHGDPGGWGRCLSHRYVHRKHNCTKLLGVHAYGACCRFERCYERAHSLLQSYVKERL